MAFDYKKEYKEYYLPKDKPSIVTVPPMNFVAVRGKGDPNAESGEYKEAIGLLYGIAFTIKMSKKGSHQIEGYFDYVVPPLEGFWWQAGVAGVDYAHKENFEWISLIRLPDFDAPAPKLVADTGEYHAVAHADGGFAARRAQIDGGMRLPAVKRRPKHGLSGEAAKQPAGNGANRAHNGRKTDGRERRQRRRVCGRRGGRGGDLRRGGGGLHVFRLTETVGIQRRADDDGDHRAERHPIGVIQQPFPRLTQTVFEQNKHGHPSLLKEG